jgi:hypothetical protein
MVMGVLFFEGIQLLILWRMGIARTRYMNILFALSTHAGGNARFLQSFTPIGSKIVQALAELLAFWHTPLDPRKKIEAAPIPISLVATISALVGAACVVCLQTGFPWATLTFGLFLLFCVVSFMPMFFYWKRAFSVFPIFLLFLCALFQPLIDLVVRNIPHGLWWVSLLLGLASLAYLHGQWRSLKRLLPLRSHAPLEHSNALDALLPPNTAVYAHCYGMRFLWQSRHCRFFSCDDQVMNNQMIVDWAINEQGKYVLLCSLGGAVEAETAALLRPLAQFPFAESDADTTRVITLFELTV